ncbi:MAG TPA: phospholipase D family protein [Syntrophales bacterium]|nr:phospholipase D family protein [Syntrophales bacterium]
MARQALYLGLIFMLTILPPCVSIQAYNLPLSGDVPAEVYFSPNGGCTDAILNWILKSNSEILVQAYSFQSSSINQALLEAHKRGVKVQIILDKSERSEGFTPAAQLANAGIPIYLDGIHAVANNRIIIIDKEVVITGSFNFNKASEEMNAENLLILKSKDLSTIYRNNWISHQKHSEPY